LVPAAAVTGPSLISLALAATLAPALDARNRQAGFGVAMPNAAGAVSEVVGASGAAAAGPV
jgi:hypothetical protein